MTGQLFWLGVSVYCIVMLAFAAMTWRERRLSDRRIRPVALGLVCCVFWPLTLVTMAVMVKSSRPGNR